MTETEKKLIQISAKRFKTEESALKPDDDFFEKLKINSVDALNLLSDLEMAFGVEVPDYELQDVRTFTQLARIIDQRR